MTNNPLVYYKPGLTMDKPIDVTLAAADWAIIMAWATSKDTNGVHHILEVMARQLAESLYDPSSLKAYEARRHEQQNHPLTHILQNMGIPTPEQWTTEEAGRIQQTIFTDSVETWLTECDECKDRDEYPPYYGGILSCGHNGQRHAIQIIVRPKGDGIL